MGRTAFTEPQCLYSTAIPLLSSEPVQYSYTFTPLRACTVQLYLYSPQCLYSTAITLLSSEPVQYSYTTTPPMDRKACTEPQCLYSIDISLLPSEPYSTAIPLHPSVHVEYSYISTPLSSCTVQLYLYSPQCM